MSYNSERKTLGQYSSVIVKELARSDLYAIREDLWGLNLLTGSDCDKLKLPTPNSDKARVIFAGVSRKVDVNPKDAFPKFLDVLRKHLIGSPAVSAMEETYSENGGDLGLLWTTPVAQVTSKPKNPQNILESIVSNAGIGYTNLEQCPDYGRLMEISYQLGAHWESFALGLGLHAEDLKDLQTKYKEVQEQAFQALAMWKQRRSFTATYKELVDVFISLNQINLAEFVCKLLA